ncbi:MAG: hypothetical protein RL322_2132 [Pseudomonadota bacterium]|jgi:hypothetical protein
MSSKLQHPVAEVNPAAPIGRHAELFATTLMGTVAHQASLETDPEHALHHLVSAWVAGLGNRQAHLQAGTLRPGERQYYVGGCFMVTPDQNWHMLIANSGFPAEQRRLMIPIEAGHPGRVRQSGQPMLLANTDEHGDFRQYLKSSKMGSSIYAPLFWEGRFIGQIVMAAQARYTMAADDLAVLVALAPLVSALWVAKGGPDWLARHYPPPEGFRVDPGGVTSDASR